MPWLTELGFLLLIVVAVVTRMREGSWYSPAAFFTVSWCVLAGLPLLIGPIRVAPGGILFVVAACLALAIGAEASRRWLGVARPQMRLGSELPLLEWLLIGCAALGIAAVIIVLDSRGRGPGVFLSIKALEATARDFSVARYTGTWQEPITARLLVTFNYLGALLAGVMFATRRSGRARWLALLAFLPAAMMAAVLTTKASLLIPIAMAASSFLAMRLAIERETPKLNASRALLLAALAIGSLAALVLIQMGRYAYTTPAQAGIVLRLFVSSLAYLGVFSNWLQGGGWSTLHPSWGLYTFAGVFDLLHIGSRVSGLFSDQATVDGAPYNIYTAFRGLIQDFTLPGAMVALGVVGFGSQAAYSRARLGDIRQSAPLAAFYAFAVWSCLADIFANNTVMAACLMLACYLWLAAFPRVGQLTTRFDTPWRGSRSISVTRA